MESCKEKMINFETCKANDVAMQLILRFQGNIKLAEQFLARIGTCLDEEATKQVLEYKESDNAAASSFELSCIAPRGKHKIMIYEDRQEILIRNKNGAKVVLKCDEAGFYSAVTLDKKYLMVSHVASNFKYEKPNNKVQELNCICIAYDENVASKIIDLLNISKIVDVSSSKGINAYYNRDMGKLCLVESHGLVFFKPPVFLHKDRIANCEWASGSSRFVNLVINDGEIEFESIDRDLANDIQSFLVNMRAMGSTTAEKSDDSSSDEKQKEGGGRRSKRKAAKIAQKTTWRELNHTDGNSEDDENSDDEEDYVARHSENDGTDESDDDDDDDDDDSARSSCQDTEDSTNDDGSDGTESTVSNVNEKEEENESKVKGPMNFNNKMRGTDSKKRHQPFAKFLSQKKSKG